MNLKIIVDGNERKFDENILTLPISYMQHKATHLFIASHKWDELYCELTDDIPPNCLCYIVSKVNNVKVKLPEKCTSTTMKLLTELYPGKAGSIRKAFISGKSLEEVVNG